MQHLSSLDNSVKKLAELLSSGVITLAEFDERRKKLLSQFVGTSTPTRGAPAPTRGAQPVRRASLPTPSPRQIVPSAAFANARIPQYSKPTPAAIQNPYSVSAIKTPIIPARGPVNIPPRAPTSFPARAPTSIPARAPASISARAPASVPGRLPMPGFRGQPASSTPLSLAQSSRFSSAPLPTPSFRQPATQRPLAVQTSLRRPGQPAFSQLAAAKTLVPKLPARGPGPIRTTAVTAGQRFAPYAAPAAAPKPAWHGRTIIVRPVPYGIPPEELKERFAAYGEVSNAVVQRGEEEGCTGIAVITFAEPSAAQAAVAGRYIELDGVLCWVDKDKGRNTAHKPTPVHTLVLSNLPAGISQTELRDILMHNPGIQSVLPPVAPTAGHPGYAFIRFDSVENATYSKNALSGLVLKGHLIEPQFASLDAQGVAKPIL